MSTLKSLDQLITQMRLDGVNYEEAVKLFRRQFVVQVLKECRLNQCHAATALGLHRNTISRYMDELGIDLREVKHSLPTRLRRRGYTFTKAQLEGSCQQ